MSWACSRTEASCSVYASSSSSVTTRRASLATAATSSRVNRGGTERASYGRDRPAPEAVASAPSGGGGLLGEVEDPLDDQVLVVVEGGDVVAALEGDPLDRTADRGGQVIAVRGGHDVVLGRVEDQHRAGDPPEPLLEVDDGVEQGEQGSQRAAVVGGLGGGGVGDVGADAREDLCALVDGPGDDVAHRSGRLSSGVDERQAGEVGVPGAEPGGEGATHREADDDDAAAGIQAGPEAIEGGLGLGG